MKLYIANCTPQNHVINYRIPENQKTFTQSIPMGSQIPVSGVSYDLTKVEIDSIVAQLAIYGLRAADDVGRNSQVVPLVYSVDKPVTSERMRKIIDHNRGVKIDTGRKRREEAAIAAVAGMENMTAGIGNLASMEVTVEQQTPGSFEGEKSVGEGFRTDPSELAARAQQGSSTGRKGGKKS